MKEAWTSNLERSILNLENSGSNSPHFRYLDFFSAVRGQLLHCVVLNNQLVSIPPAGIPYQVFVLFAIFVYLFTCKCPQLAVLNTLGTEITVFLFVFNW